MAVNDPIGDMITRIRNAHERKRSKVSTPASKQRQRVLDVLAEMEQDVGIVARGDAGDDHADEAGALGDEGAGDVAGGVAEFAGGAVDAGAQRGRDRGAVAEGAADGGLRHAGAAGDVVRGHARAAGGGRVVDAAHAFPLFDCAVIGIAGDRKGGRDDLSIFSGILAGAWRGRGGWPHGVAWGVHTQSI